MPPGITLSSGLLVILSGPSGAGKDSVMNGLRDYYGDHYAYHFAVTATTRKMRPGERDGEPYRFLSHSEFEVLLASGGLLEHAVVYGNHYGTLKAPVKEALSKGHIIFLKVDVQGVEAVRYFVPDALAIFITPPSMALLRSRLESRGTESAHELELRMSRAEAELEMSHTFNRIVFNNEGRLDETIADVLSIVKFELHSGRHRRHYL